MMSFFWRLAALLCIQTAFLALPAVIRPKVREKFLRKKLIGSLRP